MGIGVVWMFLSVSLLAQKSERDGPYVIVKADSSEVAYQVKVAVSKEEQSLSISRQLPLKVNTDQEGRHFSVSMKRELSLQPSVYTDNKSIVHRRKF